MMLPGRSLTRDIGQLRSSGLGECHGLIRSDWFGVPIMAHRTREVPSPNTAVLMCCFFARTSRLSCACEGRKNSPRRTVDLEYATVHSLALSRFFHIRRNPDRAKRSWNETAVHCRPSVVHPARKRNFFVEFTTDKINASLVELVTVYQPPLSRSKLLC